MGQVCEKTEGVLNGLMRSTCVDLLNRKKCGRQLQKMVLLRLVGSVRSLPENIVMIVNATKKTKDVTARKIVIETETEKRTENTAIAIESATGPEITIERKRVAVRGTIIVTMNSMGTGHRAIMAGSEIRIMSETRIAMLIGHQDITGTTTANAKGMVVIGTERALMVLATAEIGTNLLVPEERNGSEVRPYMTSQRTSTKTNTLKNVLRRSVAFAVTGCIVLKVSSARKVGQGRRVDGDGQGRSSRRESRGR